MHRKLILTFILWCAVINIARAQEMGASLSAIWANDGCDKVTKDELRATNGINVKSSVWDGSKISIFGAKNEIVSFNVILESAKNDVSGVRIEFDRLVGPDNSVIASKQVTKDEAFNFIGRNIELFYIRYLQIKGLSRLSYEPSYDERHVPARLRLPYKLPKGTSTGLFEDRPDANKFYPDIAVPLEAVGIFDIKKGENQSIWVDIYIPKDSPAGLYKGEVKVHEGEQLSAKIPVNLEVLPFVLPDVPSAKTMIYYSDEDINDRYLGKKWPDMSKETLANMKRKIAIWKNHHLLAHRHKVSLIDDGRTSIDSDLIKMWTPVLTGNLFTIQNGYDGPGIGVSSGVYSIGTYGGWRNRWDEESKEAMWQNTDNWVWLFEKKFPNVEYFLYLLDEPKDKILPDVEKWASWVKENPGIGHRLKTLVTENIVKASKYTPSVDIAFTGWGDTAVWKPVVDLYNKEGKQYWAYNGRRPMTGSFAIEDDGVALRVLAWTQFKHKVARWFYWEATQYKNSSHVSVETNVFRTAWTFGREGGYNPKYGDTGPNYNNGDGVLFYPGTEMRYPEDNYGLLGPIASLRLKLWRRGIQDVDYLTMAAKVNPEKVNAIVQDMIPKTLWEVGVTDPKDPSYVHTDISWSTDPDVWEKARRELANIIIAGNEVKQ